MECLSYAHRLVQLLAYKAWVGRALKNGKGSHAKIWVGELLSMLLRILSRWSGSPLTKVWIYLNRMKSKLKALDLGLGCEEWSETIVTMWLMQTYLILEQRDVDALAALCDTGLDLDAHENRAVCPLDYRIDPGTCWKDFLMPCWKTAEENWR